MMFKRDTGRKEIGGSGASKQKGLSGNPVDRRRVDGGRKNKRARQKRRNRATRKTSTINSSPLIPVGCPSHVYRMQIYVSYFISVSLPSTPL